MDQRILFGIGGLLVGGAIGAGVTYKLMFTLIETKIGEAYDEALDQELESTRRFYTTMNKVEYPTPGDLLAEKFEKGELLIEDLEYAAESEVAENELTQVSENVFTNYAELGPWDADAEEAQRESEKPYVITADEFFENAPEFEQTQLTYFNEDGILADTDDKPVEDEVVGAQNLERFGHGSKDPNIVYVRNEALEGDYEIVRAEGKYGEQVMGFLQHDGGHRRETTRKFRLHDED